MRIVRRLLPLACLGVFLVAGAGMAGSEDPLIENNKAAMNGAQSQIPG